MALDFLSSDIVFPSDSSESKLATGVVTKLPEPVDWAFHDYYSTASEKAAMPLHSLTDYYSFEAVQSSSNNTKSPPQVDLLVPPAQDNQQYLRAILCGALETVNNSMQNNHLTRLDKFPNTTTTAKDDWRWEDDIMNSSSDFGFPPYQDHHPNPIHSSPASSLDLGHDEDADADFPAPIYVEDMDDDLMSSGLSSLIISASPSPLPLTPPFQERVFPPSLNGQVPHFYSTPSSLPFTTTRVRDEEQGKQAIAKSTVWKNLVGRLKKNLASPLASNSNSSSGKKAVTPSTPKYKQHHLPSNPLKRFFKTRLQ